MIEIITILASCVCIATCWLLYQRENPLPSRIPTVGDTTIFLGMRRSARDVSETPRPLVLPSSHPHMIAKRSEQLRQRRPKLRSIK